MDFTKMSDEEILNIVEPIMDNLMDASTEINHERHVRDFSDRLKKIVTKEYLESVCKKYQEEKGFFSTKEFVSLFKRPKEVAVVWKQKFTKAEGDFVAELLLFKKDDKFVVDHTMVF